jgi:hypothetical protein
MFSCASARQSQRASVAGRGGGGMGPVGRGYIPATPASVLRQQVFSFGNESSGYGAPVGLSDYSVASGGGNMGGGNEPMSSGLSLAGASVVGRTFSANSSNGNSGNNNSYPGANNGVVNGRYVQGQPSAAAGPNVRNNATENEEMLRQLFPGWF